MCRRVVRLAMLLLVLGGWSLAAQAARPDNGLLVAVAEYTRLVQARRVRDSIRLRRGEEDTVVVGALRLLVLPEVAVVARAAARPADAELARRYGPAVAALRRAHFRLTAERGPDLWQLVLFPARGGATSRGGMHSAEEVRAMLVSLAEQEIWRASDSALRHWLPATVQDVRDSARFRRFAYYELALSPAVVARGCMVGDIGSCGAALALDPEPEPLTRWYDAAGRRALVGALGSHWSWGHRQLERYACIEEKDDAACTSLLLALGGGDGRTRAVAHASNDADVTVPPPLGERSRLLLLQVATTLGGEGAWARLVATPTAPLGDRLAAAAGVPADSLLGVWRAVVEEWRPLPIALPAGLVSSTVLWVGAIAALSCWGLRWR